MAAAPESDRIDDTSSSSDEKEGEKVLDAKIQKLILEVTLYIDLFIIIGLFIFRGELGVIHSKCHKTMQEIIKCSDNRCFTDESHCFDLPQLGIW